LASDEFHCPSPTVTTLAVVVCGSKFRLEAFGRPVPFGYTVSRLKVLSFTATTLSATAVALLGIDSPVLGSVYPVTWSVRVSPGRSAPVPHWMQLLERVSRIRKGVK